MNHIRVRFSTCTPTAIKDALEKIPHRRKGLSTDFTVINIKAEDLSKSSLII